MRWIIAAITALSTYTRVPMPQVKWNDDVMKLAIAFLPLAGAIVGSAVWGWGRLCGYLGMGAALFAAIASALPVFVTGGIHMDGYCDTSDALASWQSRERMLEIMKDPHIGAFALTRCVIYLLINFGLFCELYTRGLLMGAAFIYPLSRCFSAWSALTMPAARKDGMLAAFTTGADRRTAYTVLAAFTAISSAGLLWCSPQGGATALVLCLLVTLRYRRTAKKYFGGATGDTTGYYQQTLEIFMLAGLVCGGILYMLILRIIG